MAIHRQRNQHCALYANGPKCTCAESDADYGPGDFAVFYSWSLVERAAALAFLAQALAIELRRSANTAVRGHDDRDAAFARACALTDGDARDVARAWFDAGWAARISD